jgi:hypothetical protein
VSVGNPGSLKLKGKSIAKSKKQANGAGTYKLKVKPKGKLKRKLAKKGKAKLKGKVVFAPQGGKPATLNAKIKLLRK